VVHETACIVAAIALKKPAKVLECIKATDFSEVSSF
jgi:hypothetical protein